VFSPHGCHGSSADRRHAAWKRMRSVFDDPQSVSRRERFDRVDVHHQSRDMNRHDANDRYPRGQAGELLPTSDRLDLGCGIVEVHVECDGIAIDENGKPALVPDHFRSRRQMSSLAQGRLVLETSPMRERRDEARRYMN
jgi:hypothetical protein